MRKVIPMAVAGGVLVASGGVFGAAQALAKDVELSQDGMPTHVRTWDGTVGDVLDRQGITLGEHDVIAPSPDDRVTDGQQISVRYGRELMLTVDGETETLWTTALTLDEALAERSIRDESQMSTSRNAAIGREGLSVDIETAKKVTLVVAEEEPRELITPAETVAEALAEAEVELSPEDSVEPAVETPIEEDLTVTVQRNENRETTKTVDVPFETVRKNSDSLPEGTEKIETEGVLGTAVETWVERFENGTSVRNDKTGTRIEEEPVNQIVLVGTRSAAPPVDDRSSSQATRPAPAAPRNAAPAPAPAAPRNEAPAAPRSSAPAPAPAAPQTSAPASSSGSNVTPANGTTCMASNYSVGSRTANGEAYDPSGMTAAHKTLPFNTRVKVTNPSNGKTVVVRINDRGPFTPGRCIDLSSGAFSQIADPSVGVMSVNMEVL